MASERQPRTMLLRYLTGLSYFFIVVAVIMGIIFCFIINDDSIYRTGKNVLHTSFWLHRGIFIRWWIWAQIYITMTRLSNYFFAEIFCFTLPLPPWQLCLFVIFFRSLFFGDYMNPDSPERIYDEVTDLSQLTLQMEGWVSYLLHSAQKLSCHCWENSNCSVEL